MVKDAPSFIWSDHLAITDDEEFLKGIWIQSKPEWVRINISQKSFRRLSRVGAKFRKTGSAKNQFFGRWPQWTWRRGPDGLLDQAAE
jgi:hypothetical protein